MFWQTKKLSEVSEVFADGDWIEKKDQSSSGVRLIQTGNVGIGIFKDKGEKARYISSDTFKKLRCTEIFPGDVLISRLPDPVGRSCIIPKLKEQLITAVDCTIVRFKISEIIPEYFNYFSQSQKYLSEIDNETTGTTRKRISRKGLGEVLITFPRVGEQKRIVKVLDEVFKKIEKAKENTKKNLQNSRELFESYLHEIYQNPKKKWERKTIQEIAKILGGKRVPRGYKLKNEKTKHPYIRVSDFTNYGTVSTSNIKYIDQDIFEQIKRYTISSKDLYISIAGTIGKTGIIPEELEGANLTENACKLVFKPNINNKFVYYFTESADFMNQAGLNTRVVAMPKLALSRLATISFFIPDNIVEQNEVVKKLDKFSEQTKKLEEIYKQKLANLEELKKSILQKAFAGELVNKYE